jgi:hypothetical protein
LRTDPARPSSRAVEPEHTPPPPVGESPESKATTEESDDRRKRHLATQDAIRAKVARAVRIVFAILATILALGALLIVLRHNINSGNPIVHFVLNVADDISGPFSRNDGIFHFTGKSAVPKNALLNWGIAAIVYLLIGRFLANAIAPKGKR